MVNFAVNVFFTLNMAGKFRCMRKLMYAFHNKRKAEYQQQADAGKYFPEIFH